MTELTETIVAAAAAGTLIENIDVDPASIVVGNGMQVFCKMQFMLLKYPYILKFIGWGWLKCMSFAHKTLLCYSLPEYFCTIFFFAHLTRDPGGAYPDAI